MYLKSYLQEEKAKAWRHAKKNYVVKSNKMRQTFFLCISVISKQVSSNTTLSLLERLPKEISFSQHRRDTIITEVYIYLPL